MQQQNKSNERSKAESIAAQIEAERTSTKRKDKVLEKLKKRSE
jgi:hypothetical protein